MNTVWINWISEITGDLGIKPEDLTKSFYYRAYFNMGVGDIFEGLGFPHESMEMLMGSLPRGAARPSFKPSARTFSRLPWLIAFVVDKWNFGSKMRRVLPALREHIDGPLIQVSKNSVKVSCSLPSNAITRWYRRRHITTSSAPY